MAFTRTNRTRSNGKRDTFGNLTKNVFCKEVESKQGNYGYKGFVEINNRLYGIYFKPGSVQDNKGRAGAWVSFTEYKNN